MSSRWSNRTEQHRLPRSWHRMRGHVLKRDQGCCVLCGSRDRVSVDHIVPRYQGGVSTPENLRVLCHGCHGTKTSHEHVQARRDKINARWRPMPSHPGLITDDEDDR